MKRYLYAILLAAAALHLSAAMAGKDEAPPPPSAPVDENGEEIEPEVTIREEGGKTIHEYRVNGQIYMLKIVPRHGKPYYLMDLDGDGQFDEVSGDDPGQIVLPQWILFRW
jgi:hypothetical protein